jgi:hypothetical protein
VQNAHSSLKDGLDLIAGHQRNIPCIDVGAEQRKPSVDYHHVITWQFSGLAGSELNGRIGGA